MAVLSELNVNETSQEEHVSQEFLRTAKLSASYAFAEGRFCGIDFQVQDITPGASRAQFDATLLQSMPGVVALPQSPRDKVRSILTVRYDAPGIRGFRNPTMLVKELHPVGARITMILGLYPSNIDPFVLDIGDGTTISRRFEAVSVREPIPVSTLA